MRITRDTLIVGVLTIILSTLSILQILALRAAQDNQLDRAHFADYVECLFVEDVRPADCRNKL